MPLRANFRLPTILPELHQWPHWPC